MRLAENYFFIVATKIHLAILQTVSRPPRPITLPDKVFSGVFFLEHTAMIPTFSRKLLLAAIVVSAASLMAGSISVSIGQEKQKSETKEKKKGKLPAYYADLVSEAQRQQIYAIQQAHEKKIAALREQLDAAEKARDTEIEAVLDAQQKAKLATARAEAAAKKAKAAAEKK